MLQKSMVSIIIPTFNRPRLLDKLLESIKNQTFKDFEVLVIDDFSDSQEQNKAVCDKYFFVNYFLNETNKGAPYSRNIGIKHSKYDILCFVDDDDEWDKKKLFKQYNYMNNENFDFVYSWAQVVEESGKSIGTLESTFEGNISERLLMGNFIPSSSVMIRKACFEKVGYFDESFKSCQDWEMWFRISKEYKIGVVKEHLIMYYKHSLGSIGLSRNGAIGYMQFFLKYYKDFYHYGLLIKGIKLFLYGFKNLLLKNGLEN